MPPLLSPGRGADAWAKGLRLEEFELLCLDGTRKPVAEAKTCHLAKAPSHAVVSRRDRVEYVERVLLEQQVRTPRASARRGSHSPATSLSPQPLRTEPGVTAFAPCCAAAQGLSEDNRGSVLGFLGPT